MDRKITIMSLSKSQNTTGEEETTLSTLAEPWAYMAEQNGSEDIEGKVRHIIDRSYTIRYNATVAATGNEMILVDGSRAFDVYHVIEIGRKQHLKLLVTRHE